MVNIYYFCRLNLAKSFCGRCAAFYDTLVNSIRSSKNLKSTRKLWHHRKSFIVRIKKIQLFLPPLTLSSSFTSIPFNFITSCWYHIQNAYIKIFHSVIIQSSTELHITSKASYIFVVFLKSEHVKETIVSTPQNI